MTQYATSTANIIFRTVVCTVTVRVLSASLSQTRHTVFQVRTLSVCKTTPGKRSQSARLFSLATRPCSSPTLLIAGPNWPFQIRAIGAQQLPSKFQSPLRAKIQVLIVRSYYINPPGYSTEEACIWGDGSKPIGNWSPYVAGANTDGNGNTFVKVAWNPIYLEPTTSFRNELPTFGVKIVCVGGGCNGLPCSIDPAVNGINQVTSSNSATGAGGGDFCVVTVPKGSSANIVVFNAGNSDGGSSSSKTSQAASSSTTSKTTTTSTTTTTTTSKTTTTSSSSSTSSPSSSTSSTITTSSSSSYTASSSTFSSTTTTLGNAPHVFAENATSTALSQTSASSTTTPNVTLASGTPAAATSSKSAAANAIISSALGFGAVFAVVLGHLL
jgi:hypothetical protein